MDISITDFLPKYPNLENTEFEILNPYQDKFENVLFHKKEFYENKLEVNEIFPSEKGVLTKYQKTITRFLSSYTPYNGLLLVHSMGTGKTCSAIGAIEKIKNESNSFTGAVIFGKGDKILDNFITELVEKCTAGQYKDPRYNNLDSSGKLRVSRKKISSFYKLNTFTKFSNFVKDSSDKELEKDYSNKIIVIDEVHNLRIQNDGESIENYRQFHRFLHVIKNCKILLLSGTPMKDTPQEIASVMNLILPSYDQFPEEEKFVSEYMEIIDGVKTIQKNKINDFKNKIRGKVSFLRESSSSVPKVFIGQKQFNGLKHFIVNPLMMSQFQTQYYNQAYQKDTSSRGGKAILEIMSEQLETKEETKKRGKEGKSGFYSDSKDASLFIFPNGSYGTAGFKEYIEEKKESKFDKIIGKNKKGRKKNETGIASKIETGPRFVLKEHFRKLLKPDRNTPREEILNNIRQYSVLYSTIIEKILNTKGNCFVYSIRIKGSGAVLFSLLLELFDFSRAYGNEETQKKRYALIGAGIASNPATKKVIDRFNKPDNFQGDFIQVIIGGKSASEGLSFRNIVFESINTPWWNYPEIEQAIARGIRFGSHKDLISKGIDPKVEIYQNLSYPANENGLEESIDSIMYRTAEDKDISTRKILRLLMESAIDCGINYLRNKRNSEYGSRDCDYESCDFVCDNLSLDEVLNGISDKNLDVSTYQLYYSNPNFPKIKATIEELFKHKNTLSISELQENLKNDFSEEDIENTLIVLRENNIETLESFQNFNYFSIKNFSNKIEAMFRTKFSYTIDEIMKNFPNNSLFDILTSLQNLINNNTIIIDKYGFHRYLREQNNTFFLIWDIGMETNFTSKFYTQFLTVYDNLDFKKIISNMTSEEIPIIVDNLLTNVDNISVFNSNIKFLPNEMKNFILEACLKSKYLGKQENIAFRENYIKFFDSIIHVVNNTVFIRLENKQLRCFSLTNVSMDTVWQNCTDEQRVDIEIAKHQEEKKLSKKYGIHGAINTELEKFCIVIGEMDENRLKDSRNYRPGRVCDTYQVKEILYFMCLLRIGIKQDFEAGTSRAVLLEKVKRNAKCSDVFDLWKEKQNQEPDDDTLKRMLYFSGGGNKKSLCEIVKGKLRDEGLIDAKNKLCGTNRKTGKSDASKIEMASRENSSIDGDDETKSISGLSVAQSLAVISKKRISTDNDTYSVTSFNASDYDTKTLSKFKAGSKDNYIPKEFELKLTPDIIRWHVVAKTGIVGFASETKEGFLSNIVSKETFYRNVIYNIVIKKICTSFFFCTNSNPKIKINTKIVGEAVLLDSYIKMGFVIVSSIDSILILEYDIKKFINK